MTIESYGFQEVLKVLEAVTGERDDDNTCVVCGCTDDRACQEGCFWIARGLCSACVDKAILTVAHAIERQSISIPCQYRAGQPVMTDKGPGKIEIAFEDDGGNWYLVGVMVDGLPLKMIVDEPDIRMIGDE
ncbi:MAG: hypothetical protein WC455_11745 [Dehalococcoidia bacterium]|jgi:hypothetical protein